MVVLDSMDHANRWSDIRILLLGKRVVILKYKF